MDLSQIFPHAFVRRSQDGTAPIKQQFAVGDSVFTVVSFRSTVGVPHAGIILEKVEAQSGCFQQRGFIGNPLREGVIDPINVNARGIYDLTLDGAVVASFHFRLHPDIGAFLLVHAHPGGEKK